METDDVSYIMHHTNILFRNKLVRQNVGYIVRDSHVLFDKACRIWKRYLIEVKCIKSTQNLYSFTCDYTLLNSKSEEKHEHFVECSNHELETAKVC